MSAKETAISDVRSELHKEGKVFIAYRADLDQAIDDITDEYIRLQESLTR